MNINGQLTFLWQSHEVGSANLLGTGDMGRTVWILHSRCKITERGDNPKTHQNWFEIRPVPCTQKLPNLKSKSDKNKQASNSAYIPRTRLWCESLGGCGCELVAQLSLQSFSEVFSGFQFSAGSVKLVGNNIFGRLRWVLGNKCETKNTHNLKNSLRWSSRTRSSKTCGKECWWTRTTPWTVRLTPWRLETMMRNAKTTRIYVVWTR